MTSGLLGLPNELKYSVAEYVQTPDLPALCRTNRQIHSVCLRRIYGQIILKNPAQIVQCCKTLISRQEAAGLVRELTISCHPKCGLKSFYRIVGCAIRGLKNLRFLASHNSLSIFKTISDISFTHLVECAIPSAPEIIPFLRNNPQITVLKVIPSEEICHAEGFTLELFLWFTTPMEPLSMPALQRFVGPSAVAHSVVPGSRTSTMAIYWHSKIASADPPPTLPRSDADLTQLENYIDIWDVELLSIIAPHAAHLQYLSFVNISENRDKDTFTSAIDAILPLCPYLMRIDLESPAPLDNTIDALDKEFGIVRRWHNICPTLSIVSFTSQFKWIQVSEVWIPSETGDISAHINWLFKKVFSSPTLPPRYRALAQFLAGADGMRALQAAFEENGELPVFHFESLGVLVVE